jgi:hypothetical protein
MPAASTETAAPASSSNEVIEGLLEYAVFAAIREYAGRFGLTAARLAAADAIEEASAMEARQ